MTRTHTTHKDITTSNYNVSELNTSNRNETLFNRPQEQIDTSEIILHKVTVGQCMNMNITITSMKLTTVTTMSCSDGYPPL